MKVKLLVFLLLLTASVRLIAQDIVLPIFICLSHIDADSIYTRAINITGDVVSSGQVHGHKKFKPVCISIDNPSNLTSDSLCVAIPFLTDSVNIDSVRCESQADNQDLDIRVRARNGGSVVTLIDTTIVNNGTGEVYSVTDISPGVTKIAASDRLVILKPAAASEWILIKLYCWTTVTKR